MTKDMQEAMATVSFVLENVRKFDKEAKSYEGFGFLLMALVKKAHDSCEHLHWEENLAEHEGNLSNAQLEAARRVGQFAIDVYPASWKLNLAGIGKCLGVSEEDIVLVHFTDNPSEGHCPKFALFLDHPTRSLVLAIRGTFCLKDVVLDIVCEDVPFLAGHAHSGILTGARRILERAGHLISASLMLHPGYALTITGHSLGAGTAELLTMDFLDGEAVKLLPQGTKVDMTSDVKFYRTTFNSGSLCSISTTTCFPTWGKAGSLYKGCGRHRDLHQQLRHRAQAQPGKRCSPAGMSEGSR